ncbi:MAG: hypothetical protein MJ193_02245 [Clostridia bacterium]|nr:hypothetical protein [Clostridia bacterium]
MKTIHTNLYSTEAFDILTDALNCIAQCGRSGKIRYAAKWLKVERNPDNEVVVTVRDSWRLNSYINSNDDAKARMWLAWQIKDSIHDYDVKLWNKNNNSTFTRKIRENTYIFDVKKAYCVYELLLNRKHVKRHFGEKFVDDIVGGANDPFRTEMETVRRTELKAVTDKWEKAIMNADFARYGSDIYQRYSKAVDELRSKYEAESKELINRCAAERDKELTEINARYDAMLSIGG